ncbi:MAG: carboxymuconolactone decarboxylase family protein [Halioglobus sp.]
MRYELYNQETAPAASQPLLEQSVKNFGMIPNLHAVLAESPPALEAYQVLHKLFQQTSFNADELTVVWQTINVEHECHYCVPAHTGIAQMMKVNTAISDALRNGTVLDDEKLQALHLTTLALVRNRGRISEQAQADFFAAGYERRHLIEIILGLSQKVISNYVNHLADTPVDQPFQKFIWKS